MNLEAKYILDDDVNIQSLITCPVCGEEMSRFCVVKETHVLTGNATTYHYVEHIDFSCGLIITRKHGAQRYSNITKSSKRSDPYKVSVQCSKAMEVALRE